MGARGLVCGITRATRPAHLARAAFEGVGHRITDLLEAYVAATGEAPDPLLIDGGGSSSPWFLQLVADLSGLPVTRAPIPEATARGAALVAGLAVEVFPGLPTLPPPRGSRVLRFRPGLSDREREQRRAAWQKALARARGP
jgi:glycerol kinase